MLLVRTQRGEKEGMGRGAGGGGPGDGCALGSDDERGIDTAIAGR